MTSLLSTLLELGHQTSQNLGFAQASGPGITFGEETITETNLLELKRRNPSKVVLKSFSKAQESKATGADWEWHIIGRAYTLKLRVQAKRIHRAGGTGKLDQKGKYATTPQIDLLLQDAKIHGLIPIYCFYCSEEQRTYWKAQNMGGELGMMETGCLIVDAARVKSIKPRKLWEIESDCIPWHYLCLSTKGDYPSSRKSFLPTVDELNNGIGIEEKNRVVHKSLVEKISIYSDEFYLDRQISKLIQIDVR